MNQDKAEKLAAIIGGEPWHGESEQWLVIKRRRDGGVIAFSDDAIAEYESEQRLAAGETLVSILLSDDSPIGRASAVNRTSVVGTAVMPLVLHPPYYHGGFFYVRVKYNMHLDRFDGQLKLVVGQERKVIDAVFERASPSGRGGSVYGGEELRDWFYENCDEMQTVYLDLSQPSELRLALEPPIDGDVSLETGTKWPIDHDDSTALAESESTVRAVDEPFDATVFPLVVHPTYYRHGFFNVRKAYDRFVRRSEGPIQIVLGTDDDTVEGLINREANSNGTARIYVGHFLQLWFSRNVLPRQTVYVDLSSMSEIRITLDRPTGPPPPPGEPLL